MHGDLPPPEAESVAEHAACGLLQTDASGVIRWVNGLFCSWVGYERAEIVGRRKMQDFLTVGGRIFHQTHWSPLMAMQHSVSEVKFEMVTADRTLIPIVMNGIRRRVDGEIVHDLAVFIARDRDRYERELLLASERLREVVARSAQLEEAARDRAMFAEQMMGIVSHDLRNPLATIDLSAMIISTGELGAPQQAALARITRATSRSVRLIRDLLDFTQARLGAGLAVAPVPIDLHDTLGDTLDELRSAFPSRELIHWTEGEGSCDADPDRLAQLVSNLVTNAITYGRVDSPVIVTSRIADDECTIAVHNQGRPIDPAIVAVLFEPMARGATNPDGTRSVGLGLYIVREIVKAHRGDVTVTSTAEKGTTFSARFSRRRSPPTT